jgi:hypothetical protein
MLHEDVFVHEREAEVIHVHRTAHRLNKHYWLLFWSVNRAFSDGTSYLSDADPG